MPDGGDAEGGVQYGQGASDAGQKAFIVNRIGDAGLILGIILAFHSFGTLDLVDIASNAGSLAGENLGEFGVITAVCLLPEFLVLRWNVPFYFGGTSLLIIVVVTMDFWAQVQSYVMSQQYESLLKKANFKTS